MKSTLKKVLALVLSLLLIAVPLSTVMAESADEEPVVTETPEEGEPAEEGGNAILDLLDEFTFDLALIENSSLPDYIKEILINAIGSYNEFAEGLVHEDGTPMTDEEALEYLITEMVNMIVNLVNMVIQIVNMVSSMSNVAAEAEPEV